MANFDPLAARQTRLFIRRRDPVAPSGNPVFDALKFHRVRFDTDIPGEPIQYYEPDSDNSVTIQAGGGVASSGVDINPGTPIEAIEVFDSPPNSDCVRFD